MKRMPAILFCTLCCAAILVSIFAIKLFSATDLPPVRDEVRSLYQAPDRILSQIDSAAVAYRFYSYAYEKTGLEFFGRQSREMGVRIAELKGLLACSQLRIVEWKNENTCGARKMR